ncbi:Armadillo-type fold [Pseudocohnilembus persalinus]|uniref:Armadillo-type fold n=1 Tax=Pseudocohnilembus persalinus TaxID=266149 RepID=A0A0V0R0Z5_PSEPJ|nr:Armadillo-type fold [Pseudocohnilembus persalinus]|eukprot:KRX08226.1 Armadillo-type fold [Pseudocohnilembus persalinus]
MQEQTKSIFSQNENLFQQVQSQKNDKKIVKEALNQKREDFRVQVRKQQTFNQLKLKRLKFTNENQGDQKQIDMQVFDSYIKQIIEFQVKQQQQEQSEQPNNNLVSQFVQINLILEKIRNISFNENYAQILCKNDSFLNTLVSLLQNSNIQKNHQDSTLTQFSCEICWIISNLCFYSSYFPFQNINFMEQLAETVLSLLQIQSIQIKAIVIKFTFYCYLSQSVDKFYIVQHIEKNMEN